MNTCPCGAAAPYAACCEPIIAGARPAATPEELMRARYTAHAKVEIDFLYNSTHPDHRNNYDHKGTKRWAEESQWLGLEIVDTVDGGEKDARGTVEFVARFRDKSGIRTHHEVASFERQKGQWLFTEGTMVKPKPLATRKVGRNDPCTCGSGRKYKVCCGR